MRKNLKKYYKKVNKICFFLPSMKTGGAEKVFLNIANNISSESKYKIFFIVGNSSGIYKNFLSKKIIFINLNTSRLRYTFFKLIKILKKEKFNVVFTTMPHSNVFLCIIKKIFRFNFELIVRQSNIYKIPFITLKSFIFLNLMKFTYRYADYVVSNCKAVFNETSSVFKIKKNKNILIYNPTNFKFIKKISKEKVDLKFFKTKEKKIISIGKLSKQKNFERLIEAANYLINELKKNYKFLIIGEGENLNILNKKIEEFKLKKNIKIIKFVKNPYKYIDKSDLVVQPSLWEGSSNILLEALSCNKRIVCFDIKGGTREILLNGKNGFIARYDDYKDLAKKISVSFDNKNNIDKRSLSLFGVENNIEKYKKLFNRN